MSAVGDIMRMRCPKCRKGGIFKGIYSMRKTCPVCGFDFEPENGYFLGAMIIGYFLGAFSTIPTIAFLVFGTEVSRVMVVVIPVLQLLVTSPIFFHYSRTIWIYLDKRAVASGGHI